MRFILQREAKTVRERVRKGESLPLINNKGRRGSDNSCGSSSNSNSLANLCCKCCKLNLRDNNEQTNK